jgi:RNA polymerase sigma factor (sigma-70 family)
MFFAFILSIVVVFVIVSVKMSVKAFHLSPSQMYFVRGTLMNPELTSSQRDAKIFSELPELSEWSVFQLEEGGLSPNIQNLLYITHEKWAKKQALDFKLLHCYKCRDLSLEDLVFSGKIGLMKSAAKYNGKTTFAGFSEIYVKSELLRTLTAHLSITSCVSSKERMRSSSCIADAFGRDACPVIFRQYIPRLNPLRISPSTGETEGEYTRTNRPKYIVSAIFPPEVEIQHKEFYGGVWDFVDTFDPLTKYVIRSKYYAEFKVRKSNTEIAEMMSCSEETVRKAVNRFSREYLEMSQSKLNYSRSERGTSERR